VSAGSIECRADHFSCGAAQPCIPWSWRCDGHVDCTSGHDESSETCKFDWRVPRILSAVLRCYFGPLIDASKMTSQRPDIKHQLQKQVGMVWCVVWTQAATAAAGRTSSCAVTHDAASLNVGFVILTATAKMAQTRPTAVCHSSSVCCERETGRSVRFQCQDPVWIANNLPVATLPDFQICFKWKINFCLPLCWPPCTFSFFHCSVVIMPRDWLPCVSTGASNAP